MLPEFLSDGNLPEGLYGATMEEILERFGKGSGRRVWLGRRLEEIVRLAVATQRVERILVWGSFVTNKTEPNDLDVFLVMASDFDDESLTGDVANLFNLKRAQLRFAADIYWMRVSVGDDVIQRAIDTWQYTRELRRRGIVEVIFS